MKFIFVLWFTFHEKLRFSYLKLNIQWLVEDSWLELIADDFRLQETVQNNVPCQSAEEKEDGDKWFFKLHLYEEITLWNSGKERENRKPTVLGSQEAGACFVVILYGKIEDDT